MMIPRTTLALVATLALAGPAHAAAQAPQAGSAPADWPDGVDVAPIGATDRTIGLAVASFDSSFGSGQGTDAFSYPGGSFSGAAIGLRVTFGDWALGAYRTPGSMYVNDVRSGSVDFTSFSVAYCVRRLAYLPLGGPLHLTLGHPEVELRYSLGMQGDVGVVILSTTISPVALRAALGERGFAELRLGQAAFDLNVMSVPADSLNRTGFNLSLSPSLRAGMAF